MISLAYWLGSPHSSLEQVLTDVRSNRTAPENVNCRAVKYDVEAAQLRDNGVFWIDFASIFQYFRNVFMNWNPALFSFR